MVLSGTLPPEAIPVRRKQFHKSSQVRGMKQQKSKLRIAWRVRAAQSRLHCQLCEIASDRVLNIVAMVRDTIKCGECKLYG